MTFRLTSLVVVALSATSCNAFAPTSSLRRATVLSTSRLYDQIVSPFDSSSAESDDGDVATYTVTEPVESDKAPLDLTWENVDLVLDEMRHFLIQDGGNVAITEIDGPVVRLELQVSAVLLFVYV